MRPHVCLYLVGSAACRSIVVHGLAAPGFNIAQHRDALLALQKRSENLDSAPKVDRMAIGCRDVRPVKRDYVDIQHRAKIALSGLSQFGSDMDYSGSIKVGTPAQDIPLIFDLGSPTLYVPTSSCETANCGRIRFNSARSTTFVNTSQVAMNQYVKGAAFGHIVRDSVALGETSLVNYTFLAAESISSTSTVDGVSSAASVAADAQSQKQDLPLGAGAGILGLSFGSFQQVSAASSRFRQTPQASTFIAETLVQALIRTKQLSQPVMGLYLARNGHDPDAPASTAPQAKMTPGSELCLGCIDSSHYTGNLITIEVLSITPGYWLAQLDAVSVGNRTIQGSVGLATGFDSGFTLSSLPRNVVANVAAAIGAVRDHQLDSILGGAGYTIDCNAEPDVSLAFGGAMFKIESSDLVIAVSPHVCALAIVGMDDLPAATKAIVGVSMLKSLYTVYSYRPATIGIAQSAIAGGSASKFTVPLETTSSSFSFSTNPKPTNLIKAESSASTLSIPSLRIVLAVLCSAVVGGLMQLDFNTCISCSAHTHR